LPSEDVNWERTPYGLWNRMMRVLATASAGLALAGEHVALFAAVAAAHDDRAGDSAAMDVAGPFDGVLPLAVEKQREGGPVGSSFASYSAGA